MKQKNKNINIENKISNVENLSGLKNLGSIVKKYATIATVGVALVTGGLYVGGCGEPSECCKELNCGSSYTCVDHYDNTCECKYDQPGPSYATQEFGLSMDDVFDDTSDDAGN
ncbi:hypothetical protein HOK51_03700 [Candidatus Woesearchaeota archaeon]|jgi:hypothetical protein|nr:hypothetical protein [Candidatus Woesearchaeota archaeon]MBT6518926.1 hypothetical protein [Candidatus Woesearchaeota archaeon]MBT7367594.1 hypothetical protein [Candidatus Woesearchaeota archaeon]